jgi:hypothetical protein
MESTGIELSELDMEIGEYLPAREVMTSCGCKPKSYSHESNTVVAGNGNGNNNGNQYGLINVGVANGSLDGNFNGSGNWIFQSA